LLLRAERLATVQRDQPGDVVFVNRP
jgi:hypothetical protein